jgi:hypothetical protein
LGFFSPSDDSSGENIYIWHALRIRPSAIRTFNWLSLFQGLDPGEAGVSKGKAYNRFFFSFFFSNNQAKPPFFFSALDTQ